MKFKTLTLILLLICVSVYAGTVVFLEYSATPATNKVTINWTTVSEENVSKFLVLRSSDDQFFAEIGHTSTKGVGNPYQFIDDNVVFKSSQTFYYKIRAVSAVGSTIEETQSLPVNPNISGMFRTWGAIKAMFR